MAKKNINVGLIGYKFMGKAHSNALSKIGMFFDNSANINMKVICGRNEEWIKQSAEKYGWSEYELSWEKLVKRPDINMIDITAPSNVHKEIAIAAANEGKHIFCEKPLALTLADAREIYETAEKNKIKHQIGFNYRFAPAVLLAKKLIDDSKIGRIFHVRANFLQDWIIDPDFPLVWRLDKKVCGSGSLGDLGAHFIDMARFLAGEFSTVMAMSKTFVKSRPLSESMTGLSGKAVSIDPRSIEAGDAAPCADVEVDDGTVFVAEFKNGALGVFEATRFAQGHKNDMSIEINGELGSLKFIFERMNELQYFSAADEPGTQGFRLIQASEAIHPYMYAWWPVGHVIGYEHTFIHELYEFTESIANDKPLNPICPDFMDGVKCSQIIEAVELSCERKALVEVDSL
ncbi:MAG: Gfo/Idh/MocA family oxidoreductase [Oscillospiraceae bacterium]|nr:Gfo/Idh/MocA family oxidoreductase [Oscillospiraceae bacterium]